MLSSLLSFGVLGMEAFVVNVEANLSRGIPSFDLVGLPDASIKEARDRVRSALINSGFSFPVKRITINLAPADIRKAGSIYDLPILIAILKANGHLDVNLDDSAFVGELSLSGNVRPIRGSLSMVIKAKEMGVKNFFLPEKNAAEGVIIEDINIYPVSCVNELLEHLIGKKLIIPAKKNVEKNMEDFLFDYSQVKGHRESKRALEIAAAGGHNVMLIGNPGSGKSMLAKRIPSILPDMTLKEAIETTKIHSVAGTLANHTSLIRKRPFRSVHHTISSVGLAGGGNVPHPGEISLSHNGVLFLDELPEFSRTSLEVLRQPMEDGVVVISRANGTLAYPCSIMLIAAMNPCPCGYFGHPTRACTCSEKAISNYLSKVSGPLLDRLDIHIEVPVVNFEELSSKENSESSQKIRDRVNAARKIQNERYKNSPFSCNSKISSDLRDKACAISDSAKKFMKYSFEKLGLSARGYDRTLKVARTIADLEEKEAIEISHISEAVQYRSLDRKYWLRNK
ncbi:MAG: YifB family Mg chelatase-like AAA ATPase [Oscillospiraceae bacterium]|jgi:magnesium chelatase family protein|nr:YifB family Mg chelatase-like AAA ATPase [Oscillospiraceae bacterium]